MNLSVLAWDYRYRLAGALVFAPLPDDPRHPTLLGSTRLSRPGPATCLATRLSSGFVSVSLHLFASSPAYAVQQMSLVELGVPAKRRAGRGKVPGRVSNDKLTLCLSVCPASAPCPTLHLPPSSDPGTCHPLCLEPTFSRPSPTHSLLQQGSGLSLGVDGGYSVHSTNVVSEWTPFTPSLSLSPVSESVCLAGPCWVAVFVPVCACVSV